VGGGTDALVLSGSWRDRPLHAATIYIAYTYTSEDQPTLLDNGLGGQLESSTSSSQDESCSSSLLDGYPPSKVGQLLSFCSACGFVASGSRDHQSVRPLVCDVGRWSNPISKNPTGMSDG
jgi:hypothetical protein